mgnify:CR=1 FL=1
MKNCKFVSKKRRYCRKSKNTRRRTRGGARRGGARSAHHMGGRKTRRRSAHRRSAHRRGGFMSASSVTPFALTAALFAKKKKGMRK